jgi:hypothetical protein
MTDLAAKLVDFRSPVRRHSAGAFCSAHADISGPTGCFDSRPRRRGRRIGVAVLLADALPSDEWRPSPMVLFESHWRVETAGKIILRVDRRVTGGASPSSSSRSIVRSEQRHSRANSRFVRNSSFRIASDIVLSACVDRLRGVAVNFAPWTTHDKNWKKYGTGN